MENWREIRREIIDALEFCDPDCKVKYHKPKDGYGSYFRIELEELFTAPSDVESLLEMIIENNLLDPYWEEDHVLILEASWDEEESIF